MEVTTAGCGCDNDERAELNLVASTLNVLLEVKMLFTAYRQVSRQRSLLGKEIDSNYLSEEFYRENTSIFTEFKNVESMYHKNTY